MPESESKKNKIPRDIVNPGQPECIDPGRSIIVVSDLHLGGTEDSQTSARFSRFLRYIGGLSPGSRHAIVHDPEAGTPKILPPQKFIILGDFLDLWDPRCNDRSNVLLDAMIPIALLGQMDCDIIFVTGNHDEDIGDLVDLQERIENYATSDPCRKEPDPCEKGTGTTGYEPDQRPERSIRYLPPVNEGTKDEGSKGLDFRTRPDRKISVYKKNYIPGPNREGLNVGGVKYAFLHGQQFDPEQITYRISEFLKVRFDPVSVIMDYANTGLAKTISIGQSILFLILWIAVLIARSGTGSFTRWLGGITFGIFALVVLHQGYLYRVAPKSEKSSRLLRCTLAVFAIIVLLLAAGFFFRAIFDLLFTIAFWILTFIAVVIAIPKIFAYVKRDAYNHIKARDKTIDDIVGKDDKKQRLYFKPDKFTLEADAVIFGHTHCAGRKLFTIPRNSKGSRAGKSFYLINSGGWVRVKPTKESQPEEPVDPCKDHQDTFVYIDTNGTSLMKWVEEEEEGNPCSGYVRVISPIPGSMLIRPEEG